MKVGLSLSGGAAKGLIHLGAIEELEDGNIPIDMIAGCSIGALVGALYALNPDVKKVKKDILGFIENTDEQIIPVEYMENGGDNERRGLFRRLTDTLRRSIYFGISLTQTSMLSTEKLRKHLGSLVPDVEFSACKIPFACATTDLVHNEAYYFTEGSLLDAVTASCSLPGLYPPVAYDGRKLIDGSWTAQNHVDKLRAMQADFVIVVDIEQDISTDVEFFSGLDVVLRANMATRNVLSRTQVRDADAVIIPDVCEINWWDFSQSKVCIVNGKSKTKDQIEEIRRNLGVMRVKKMFTWG